MIDADKVKKFWDNRATAYGKLPLESLSNFEHDPKKLERKIQDETGKVFEWLPDIRGLSILDLGAGTGQWSFRFIERGAREVAAVEYSASMAEIGASEAKRRGLTSVHFHVCPAEAYIPNRLFDLVFISGLFVYLNDDQSERLLANLPAMLAPCSPLCLRDGTGVTGRFEINDRMSKDLGVSYSAIYRSREQFTTAFERAGFHLVRDENIFPEGHPLNKFPETRMRLFLFNRA
jgi:SAM-dependent methyltransferase